MPESAVDPTRSYASPRGTAGRNGWAKTATATRQTDHSEVRQSATNPSSCRSTGEP